MTHETKHAPRRLATCPGPRIQSGAGSRAGIPAAALIGALALAGCSSGNIGESWQCPLADGGSCDSVAAADPAVPDTGGRSVLNEPLWRLRDSAPETVCEADCGGGFDPFAWLVRLFGESNDGEEERPSAGEPEPAAVAKTETLPGGPDREADAAASSIAVEAEGPPPAEPAAAALPAEQLSLQAEPAAAEDDFQADDLRTGEVVARIWIAPFVDAGGVYREASHIRVVLEPAGWRLR